MSSPSSPIDIASPNKRYGSSSPHNKTSNLTSALQQAGSGAPHMPNGTSRLSNADITQSMPRKDSLAVPNGNLPNGARPISGAGKPRRDSNNGSFMGGLSWGGMSFGSYLQDDIMMGGLSPGLNSPSFHSSSYLPRMEANFWNNLKCCETIFSNLHELVHHFETVHKQAPSHFPYTNDRLPRRKSSNTNPGDWGAHNQTRGFQPWSENRLNGLPSSRYGQASQDGWRKPSTIGMQDMDTIGEMELDDESTTGGSTYDQYQPQIDAFSSNTTPQLGDIPTNGTRSNGLNSSASTTPPGQQTQANYSNAMFSNTSQQLNRQTLQPQTQQPQFDQSQATGQMNGGMHINGGYQGHQNTSAIPFNTQMFDRLSSSLGRMEFGSGNDMRDLCINEPAKHLYSEDGTFNTSQFPQFNFNGGGMVAGDITSNNDENAKKLQAQRLAAGVGKQPTEEERPFKCPVIGCEKAYKNANGLRYHEKHGHSNQKLKDNGDGTFSIVDPITSIPYPGTVGMEKEKPYRCEVCGKRYKNLNGLKYHRNHSPPCNPDFQMNQMPNLGDGEAVY